MYISIPNHKFGECEIIGCEYPFPGPEFIHVAEQ